MFSFSARFAKSACAPAGAAAAASSLSFFSETSASRTSQRLTQSAASRWSRSFASNSGSSEAKKGNSFLQWYEGHLEARPIVTKMFTGALLWGIGDAVAQIGPLIATDKDQTERKSFTYDIPRTGRAVLFGFALHAPTSHVHFNFLEYLTNRVGVTGLGIPLFKAFMEQFVYWSWISNSMYHGAMAAMQGKNPQQIYDYIADVLWDTQVAQWSFWIPIQLLNFRYIPVRHQLNVVLLTSIIWTALLSFWYPPEQNETAKEHEALEAALHD